MRCVSALLFAALMSAFPVAPACGQTAPQVVEAPAQAVAPPAQNEAAASTEQGAPSADKLAILKAVESYVDAFNQGDAKALAAHWTPQGEIMSSGGDLVRGRQSIEADFAAYFKESPQAKIELIGAEINFVSPSVAIETGIAAVVVPGQLPSETVYEAVHVNSAQGWKIDSVREKVLNAPPPTHYEQLQRLEWMIGTWSNADDDSSVETTCRWTTNKNFLVRTFKVYVEDRVDFEGTQVIGWDPHAKSIRSWTFDSDGGFSAGKWVARENRWTVQTVSVLPDGRQGSATNVYERIDDGTVLFSSVGREVDGELLPSIEPVKVIRDAGASDLGE